MTKSQVMRMGVISPKDWGLPKASATDDNVIPGIRMSSAEVEQRIRDCTYQWLPQQFDAKTGAFYGHYRASDGYQEPPKTVNLLAGWQLMASFDRYQDEQLLDRASSSLAFYYRNFVVSHPMSVVVGGARDGIATYEVWTKFSAEFVIGALGLYRRTEDELWLEQAQQSGRYLLQAARHRFSPKYFLNKGSWSNLEFGWDSWGRAIEALLDLALVTGDSVWQDIALRWGEHALSIQAEDGSFYLIDNEYYNSDLAADELRGLAFLYELTHERRFINACRRFADWHLAHQRPDASWMMTLDRDGNVVTPIVGPGDVSNIGIALLRIHHITGDKDYLDAALGAFNYSLSKQVMPGSSEPYADDPYVEWGFWSWDPYYDYSLSPDQSTHHVRGIMFLLDYLAFLESGSLS